MKAVELNNVIKKFGNFKALDGITLSIEKGESVALLGPNGAGKTTIVKLISGLLKPTSGEVKVFGKVPWKNYEVRRMMGIVSHNTFLYDDLTAYENLQFYCRLYDADESKIDELLEFFGLKSRKHDLVRNFSRGMKQRLSIARAILHDPPLLILDEPTSGLDIEGQRELVEYIAKVGREKTIIFTTHNVKEAEEICNKVAIICNGKLVHIGDIKGDLKEVYLRVVGYEGA